MEKKKFRPSLERVRTEPEWPVCRHGKPDRPMAPESSNEGCHQEFDEGLGLMVCAAMEEDIPAIVFESSNKEFGQGLPPRVRTRVAKSEGPEDV